MRNKTQPESAVNSNDSQKSSNVMPTTSRTAFCDTSDSDEKHMAHKTGNIGTDDKDNKPDRKRKVPRDEIESNNLDTHSKMKRRRRKHNRKDHDDVSRVHRDGIHKKGRKNIRKVMKVKDLEVKTKLAARDEIQRKSRIEERRRKYNEIYDWKLEQVEVLDKWVLDFDEKTKVELVTVDKKLVKKLKPHQAHGVKFMWDACFESIDKINEGHESGCILAHCMGLGKTLQVITLIHTLLTNSNTKVKKVLVICPVSTILNWCNEFKIWLKHCKHNRSIPIYEISKFKQNAERTYQINDWHNKGGVLIIGYDMFRNLSSESNRIRKKLKDHLQKALVNPGPDLVICDEGHLLKNSKTSLSKAVNRINSLRRIVLTGTPLQNNLNEYYCMVQFVKPNLLGKYNEYLNRFVNPITNGQYTDSTEADIQMMKRRSHILHKLLDGCVQRKDYSVLAPFLPPKHEYVLYIRLTKLQMELYKYYMEHRPIQNEETKTKSSMLFQDFQNLQRIWTHPRVLRYNSDRYENNAKKKKKDALSDDEDEEDDGSLKEFMDSDEQEDDEDNTSLASSSIESSISSDSEKSSDSTKLTDQNVNKGIAYQSSRHTRTTNKSLDMEPIENPKGENPTEWWMPMCPETELNTLDHSGKLLILFSILAECEAIGEKLLVFSQSLFSLDVIEHFLSMIDENTRNPDPLAKVGGCTGTWTEGLDYFRLDGSTPIETRNVACNRFNQKDNTRARLFLISTRAGGLGINLVAANRVVIFDVSWNPSHDIQSIFRIYRFGQTKPCYIYRLIALGTMEEKIYERQVTKLAISKRVIDEHQIDRHYKENDLNELYKTNLEPEEDRPHPICPKDRMFAELLSAHTQTIYKYHEHDSLLENKAGENLSREEIEAAWKEFEQEKTRPPPSTATCVYPHQPRAPGAGPVTSNQIFGFRSDILLQLLNIKAKRDYPQHQPGILVPVLLQELYNTVQKNDMSFYQDLVNIQSEMATSPTPSYNYNPGVSNPVPYSGRGRPPLNSMPTQHQQMIQAAQNRLMNINQVRPNLPGANQVIEID